MAWSLMLHLSPCLCDAFFLVLVRLKSNCICASKELGGKRWHRAAVRAGVRVVLCEMCAPLVTNSALKFLFLPRDVVGASVDAATAWTAVPSIWPHEVVNGSDPAEKYRATVWGGVESDAS